MIQVRTTAFTYLNTEAFGAQSQRIHDALRDSTSPLFAQPPVNPGALLSAIQAYNALLLESKGGSLVVIKNRNAQRNIVTAMLLDIAAWAAFQVRNEVNAAELLVSISFQPAKQQRTRVTQLETPNGVRSQVSREPGGIDITLRAVPYAQCYSIEISEHEDGEEAHFKHYGFSTKVNFTVKGLERGKFFSIRLRAYHGKAGFSMPSQITRCMAG